MKSFMTKVGDLLCAGKHYAGTCAEKARNKSYKAILAVAAFLAMSIGANAQSLSGTDYTAGTSALETVATQVAAYVPFVVNLCYAIAGVVAVVGAISVYVAMNNEEQDVKNILSLCFGFESKRKEMQINRLNINTLRKNSCFPILSEVIFKKI